MKKILFVSLLVASTGLFGHDLPNNQSQNRRPNVHVERRGAATRVHIRRAVSRLPQTPENTAMAHAMQQGFNSAINRAAQERRTNRPAPLIIPTPGNTLATDPSDTTARTNRLRRSAPRDQNNNGQTDQQD